MLEEGSDNEIKNCRGRNGGRKAGTGGLTMLGESPCDRCLRGQRFCTENRLACEDYLYYINKGKVRLRDRAPTSDCYMRIQANDKTRKETNTKKANSKKTHGAKEEGRCQEACGKETLHKETCGEEAHSQKITPSQISEETSSIQTKQKPDRI